MRILRPKITPWVEFLKPGTLHLTPKTRKSEEKSKIILEDLKGRIEHQISQSMYYSWRDQFLTNMRQVFDTKKIDQREAYQNHKIDKMKRIIADLTIELKKSEEEEWLS